MKPSEVRERVLEDHEGLRADLDRLERLARRARSEDAAAGDVRKLRHEAQTFLQKLGVHMRWEELYLVPMLRNADAWGELRAKRLVEDHREQRRLLGFVLARLRDETRPCELVARDTDVLIDFLREDMEEEEAFFLDERVLRDDVVGIDVGTG